jgi:hypothetical protein
MIFAPLKIEIKREEALISMRCQQIAKLALRFQIKLNRL